MTSYNSSRPKSLMELLLAKKIEAASAEAAGLALSGHRLLRTDSMDSVSSIGSCTSSMLGEDVCRCDDCLLGIVDLYVIPPQTKASLSKKVNTIVYSSKWNDIELDWIEFFFNRSHLWCVECRGKKYLYEFKCKSVNKYCIFCSHVHF